MKRAFLFFLLPAIVGCAGFTAGLTDDEVADVAKLKAEAEQVFELLKASKEKLTALQNDGATPAEVSAVLSDVTSYAERLKGIRDEIESITDRAEKRGLTGWDLVGYILAQLGLGAAGYLGVGRPARLIARRFLLNPDPGGGVKTS